MDPFLPAWRIAELTRAGAIGCLEALDFYLDRTARLNPRVNAIILTDADRARARARALDNTNRTEGGPLFGVPMTVKESFDFTGFPTTFGYTHRRDHRATADALPVQRLEAEGAVVFGKTNVPVALADWQSFNPIYGTSCNPWNVDHTPGGSSGGSAAALAAGLTGLEMGSDIGGSIRVPAHYCGVFGHKSSWGLCASRGHSLFPSTGAFPDISVIGPLARSAADLRIVLHAIGKPDPLDTAAHLQIPQPRARQARHLRVAVWAGEPGQITDATARAAVEQAAHFLHAEGAAVNFTARPAFDPVEAYRIYLQMLDAALSQRLTDAALAHRRQGLAGLDPDDLSADAIMLRATDMLHRDWLLLNERRNRIRRAWQAFFQDFDVVLCPVISTAALKHDQSGNTWEREIQVDGQSAPYNDMLFWPGITCGFHLPATVAPVTLSPQGLPLGVQIAGPLHGDLTTIAVAEMLEQGLRPFVAPKGWD
jgi:amidase